MAEGGPPSGDQDVKPSVKEGSYTPPAAVILPAPAFVGCYRLVDQARYIPRRDTASTHDPFELHFVSATPKDNSAGVKVEDLERLANRRVSAKDATGTLVAADGKPWYRENVKSLGLKIHWPGYMSRPDDNFRISFRGGPDNSEPATLFEIAVSVIKCVKNYMDHLKKVTPLSDEWKIGPDDHEIQLHDVVLHRLRSDGKVCYVDLYVPTVKTR